MRTIDPGHRYGLYQIDSEDESEQELVFVKREGPKYPGNVGAHQGVTIQEVLRACIHRLLVLDGQDPDQENLETLADMRSAIWHLERRTLRRRGLDSSLSWSWRPDIEEEPACLACGHIKCTEHGMESR